jgi:hypothetical protein
MAAFTFTKAAPDWAGLAEVTSSSRSSRAGHSGSKRNFVVATKSYCAVFPCDTPCRGEAMTDAPTSKRPGRPREHVNSKARQRAYESRLVNNGFRRVQVAVPDTPEHLSKIKSYAAQLREEYWEERADAEAAELARTRRKFPDEQGT